MLGAVGSPEVLVPKIEQIHKRLCLAAPVPNGLSPDDIVDGVDGRVVDVGLEVAAADHLDVEEDSGAGGLDEGGHRTLNHVDEGQTRPAVRVPRPTHNVQRLALIGQLHQQALVSTHLHQKAVPEHVHDLVHLKQLVDLNLEAGQEARGKGVRLVLAGEPSPDVVETVVWLPEGEVEAVLGEGGEEISLLALVQMAEVKALQELQDDGDVVGVHVLRQTCLDHLFLDGGGLQRRDLGLGEPLWRQGLPQHVSAQPQGVDENVVAQSTLVKVDHLVGG